MGLFFIVRDKIFNKLAYTNSRFLCSVCSIKVTQLIKNNLLFFKDYQDFLCQKCIIFLSLYLHFIFTLKPIFANNSFLLITFELHLHSKYTDLCERLKVSSCTFIPAWAKSSEILQYIPNGFCAFAVFLVIELLIWCIWTFLYKVALLKNISFIS